MSSQQSQAVRPQVNKVLAMILQLTVTVFLLVSEMSLFRRYFARNWPLLGPEHGFVALAIAMLVLGLNILGNLNKPATSQQSLGLGFWRIVIGSGIIVFILGFVNFIAVSRLCPWYWPLLIRIRALSFVTLVKVSQHVKSVHMAR